MSKIPDDSSREQVYEFISESTSFGNLGLFVGAGFSKAVITDGSAPSWGELLEECAANLEIDYDRVPKDGVGYPQIATSLCELYSAEKKVSYDEALDALKQQICNLTSIYPSKEKRQEFSEYIESFNPAWIITTNYDLVIESLLTGRSVTLSPYDQLIAAAGIIPVFHLHGVRNNPKELVIAQEDYVALFRPNQYRQIKLALTIKESTVVLIGYALGDVNVLTALDWSKNVFQALEENYPHDVIQILYSKTPNDAPYRDKNGILIVETDDLTQVFQDFGKVRKEFLDNENKKLGELNELVETLNDSDDSNVERFIDDDAFRAEVLGKLSEFPLRLVSAFETFLDKSIEETYARSQPRGAFRGYDQNLTIILDILTAFDFVKMPPALFEILATALDKIAWFVGDRPGESHAAGRTWRRRKSELSDRMIEELRNFGERHNCHNLNELLER